MKPTYSILVTNYNSVETIREFLESVLNQIDDDFEVIVVDNKSDDGSEKILGEYEEKGKIKLVSEKCSRGRGKQIAFENSVGGAAFVSIDTDTIYKAKFREVIELYHKLKNKYDENFFIIANGGAVIPRKLMVEYGGFYDLQRGDDTELYFRLMKRGAVSIDSGIDLIEKHYSSCERGEEKIGVLYYIWDRYILLRDKMRCGVRLRRLYRGFGFTSTDYILREKWCTSYGKIFYVFLLILAKLTYKFKPCYITYEEGDDVYVCTENLRGLSISEFRKNKN